jgi:lysophospholipid acyltransferase (LPLAT)-like uncharacterized protein
VDVLHRLLGFFLGCLVRVLSFTWRVTFVVPEGLFARQEPLVFAFWHGKQLALQAVRLRRPALAMVSHSKDGRIQASALGLLGFRVIRGSSSRGGATGAKRMLRELEAGALDAVFAVDGPRGPRERAKPGAAHVASASHGILCPVGSASSARIVLRRAWDNFELPLPFARVAVVVGEPVAAEEPESLDRAIHLAVGQAEELLDPRKFSQKSFGIT